MGFVWFVIVEICVGWIKKQMYVGVSLWSGWKPKYSVHQNYRNYKQFKFSWLWFYICIEKIKPMELSDTTEEESAMLGGDDTDN